MSFYSYLKAIFPPLPFLKDGMILLSIGIVFLAVIGSRGKISKPNYLDKSIFILLIYLLFQIIYTLFKTNDIFATYYGFRLTFMYIFLYYLFRTISFSNYQRKIDSIIITILVIGCIITIVESFLTNTGIVSVEQLLTLLRMDDNRFVGGRLLHWQGGFIRVIGISGTPQITGVYNVILFSLLLFSVSIPRFMFYSLQTRPFVKYKNKKVRKFLLVLSFIAVILSTSKTAWTILFIMILLFAFFSYGSKLKKILPLFFTISIIGILYYFTISNFSGFKELIDASYFGFLEIYIEWVKLLVTPVINQSPLFGFGFEVGAYSTYLDITKIRSENLSITADFFLVQIFRMLGIVGLLFFLWVFLVFPLLILFRKNLGENIKILAVPILCVGIAFGHYNPLENPPLALCVWYFLALISNEISLNNYKIKHFYNFKTSF